MPGRYHLPVLVVALAHRDLSEVLQLGIRTNPI